MSEIDYRLTLQKHLQSLMEQADLTIIGIAEGAKLSTLTIRKILSAKTRASQITLNKITTFFNLRIEKLYSEKPIKLKRIEDIPRLRDFHNTYKANNTYFLSRAKDNIVAHFLKNVFIYDDFLKEGRRARDIAQYIEESPKYGKTFNPKVIAKELDRMFKSGLLDKDDKTRKSAVFYYRIKNTSSS